MIDRYLIRYFLAVIDHGTFSRAAQQCHVSQPTLSIGIAKLETLLDRVVFYRTNRRVELTPAGMRFATHARRIEAEFAIAERDLGEDAPTKPLRIGVLTTLPSAWIGHALAAVYHIQADERIEIVEGRARDLVQMLDRKRVDAVLGLVSEHESAHRQVFREGYAMAIASDHPLAKNDSVCAEDLGGEAMIVRRHCEALLDISRFFTDRGVRPFMAARTTSDDHALAYVRAGLGMTVMPRCFSGAGAGIAMPTLTGFNQTRSIGFRFVERSRPRVEQSVSFQRFAAALGEFASKRVATD
ncbi:LysR family transcriptional regulator [Sphingomonas glacialis]|uniref:LysR family transcriptional regulator n=1 Tax=Sphingomonas glacialis TaxID=658225 RepID=A0ABQ3LRJ9_9SPHN|nr:LysR family transcriptional regulator [Sphingomonas glacialis]GHH23962.1 LysR family transcriptional regulator [Sphingomonas glacialis]